MTAFARQGMCSTRARSRSLWPVRKQREMSHRRITAFTLTLSSLALAIAGFSQNTSLIGKEISIAEHLRNGQEYELSIPRLIQFGEKLFSAKWTIQEGAGRPNVKGT